MRAALYRVADRLLSLYWFLLRPRTAGARCILLCARHILLIRQTYGDRLWTLPGGGLARRETPEAAVRREVQEEVGITPGAVQYLGHFVSTQTYNVDTVHVFSDATLRQACTMTPSVVGKGRWFDITALTLVSGRARHERQLCLEHNI